MTREEQLKFCTKCTKRSFNPTVGVICSLTGEVANFQTSCADFNEDAQVVKMEKLNEENDKVDTKKSINKGRNALFIIGAFQIGMGVYEGFFMNGSDILYAIIDWVIGGLFIGLGIYSYKKASLALILGFALYLLIIILTAIVEPTTLVSGILWKVIIVSAFVYSIKTAREEEAKVKVIPDDLLDQL